jgi:hypothetical protein
MDRTIVYPSAIPLDSDILSAQRSAMVALGMLMNGLYGANTVAIGLACNPTTPASLQVVVGQGGMVSMQSVDASSFGSLPSDNSPLVKVGVNLGSTTFTLTAPTTTGQSINYLIEGTFTETDNTPVVLPYFNAANPSQPFSGPNNSGTPQNTKRAQVVSLQIKAGASANTGTQTTPAVDVGWVGLYVVTVNFGQSSITSTSIAKYPNAPFLAQFLQSHHGGVPGQAPKVSLVNEVQGTLQSANFPSFGGPGMLANMQVFTSNGTFTVPAGVTKVKATVAGGGSGSSGCNSSNFAGACGGGGGWSIKLCTVTPGQQIAVTVGAGGAGSAATISSGAGGTSSFGSFCSATGGQPAANAAGGINGGQGGVGSGGDLNGAGGYGSDGSSFTSPVWWPGLSGASLFAGSGRSGAAAGIAGQSYGAGAGAPYSLSTPPASISGIAGHAGVVVIEW